MQRMQRISGLTLGAPGAARIIMSELDTAIARVPGLVHDMDVSRLADAAAAGRCRASGALVSRVGGGVSRVASAYLGGRPAWRMALDGGSLVRVASAWASADFTLIYIGTIGAGSVAPEAVRYLATVADAAGDYKVVWRIGAGSMGAALLTSTGVLAPMSSLPAANAAGVFALQRAGTTLSLSLNGVVIASGTDADDIGDLSSATLNLFSSGTSAESRWDGDCARFVAYGAAVLTDYPAAYAAMVAAARAEYGFA